MSISYRYMPTTRLTITSSLEGKNSWNVFGPGYNEYRAGASALLFGEQHGWTSAYGILNEGIGSPAPIKAR